MELKLNIDETMFKDVIEKELHAFSKEELHEIIRNCITEAFKTNKDIAKLFMTESTYGWSTRLEPSPLLIKAAETFDLSPAFKEIQESMIHTLKENHREILENTMLRCIVTGLTEDYHFKTNIESIIQDTLVRNANRQ